MSLKLLVRVFLIHGALAFHTGCAASPPKPERTSDAQSTTLTVFYTADEHGWLEPNLVDGARRGGMTQLLAALSGHEEHCAGALPPAPQPSCEQARSVLLSGGDNWTGPAISSYFRGEPMAIAMRRLGYAASAFGNHEFDFGREQFDKNRNIAGYPYVAANIVGGGDAIKPYVILKRNGINIGVVGFSTVDTPRTAASHRFKGMRFEDPATSLDRAIPAAWKAGADIVVLLAHECHDRVAPLVRAHPEWDLSFAGTGHCHRTSVEVIDGTLVVGPDWRLEHYARVQLRIDSSKPQRERASLLDYELVDVASQTDQPQPSVDAALDERVAGWRREVRAALGEQIGYSRVGLGKKSNAIGQWIARAWLGHFKVDLAISTQGAIRQELPPGKITKSTVASIMPFENELVVCELHGKELDAMLRDPEAIVAGFSKSGDSWVDAEGKPIEPDRKYRVVTSDFLFFGGDGFTMHRHDRTPKMTGVNWRTPVIEWTKQHRTSHDQPLESVLRQPASPPR